MDTGADISIMGGELFKKVASVAKLFQEQFKEPDKMPLTYGNKPFKLDRAHNFIRKQGDHYTGLRQDGC